MKSVTTAASLEALHSISNAPTNDEVLPLALAAQRLLIPLAGLRHLRYHCDDRQQADGSTVCGNGFGPAFLKLGSKVYVDIPIFMEIWRSQQKTESRRG